MVLIVLVTSNVLVSRTFNATNLSKLRCSRKIEFLEIIDFLQLLKLDRIVRAKKSRALGSFARFVFCSHTFSGFSDVPQNTTKSY